ncbi:VIC potassium ion channel, beta subunit [Aspergillus mulundensis]|uniref:VIC potassium ion channel, beta subunit n=1 Tax=Aspergillus mulundensis TaxID=1810919 RepID=A0A3D8SU10_9EURO|nr:VIC potassium ion channel, beta subunit [Aspergillus mulundensis]RDW89803.1 VIC potassium ion channel, beta subunit [Aspergillus mulundensis]
MSKPEMIYRRLGNSGLHVSVISLGGWITFGGDVAEEGTEACMRQAYDLGINFFDTAEGYADGKSEIVMGNVIKKAGWKRNDLVISTKVNFGRAHGKIPVNNIGLSRKHVIEGTKASLARLQLDYVDIIYAHRPDRLTPMEEVVRAFNFVIEKGWAFYWGTSEWSADEISEAAGIAKRLGLIGPIVEQPLYNMLDRGKVEGEFARLYERVGLGLTTFSPLKGGRLSGKYNDALERPPAGSRFAESNDVYSKGIREKWAAEEGVIQQVKGVKALADKLNVKQSHLALAWCIKNENVSSIITGASKPEQIVDNVESLKVLPLLTPEVMAQIDEALGNKPAVAPARFG